MKNVLCKNLPQIHGAQETPVVLTDSVCLIPGGEPVVRLEDAPGNASFWAPSGLIPVLVGLKDLRNNLVSGNCVLVIRNFIGIHSYSRTRLMVVELS